MLDCELGENQSILTALIASGLPYDPNYRYELSGDIHRGVLRIPTELAREPLIESIKWGSGVSMFAHVFDPDFDSFSLYLTGPTLPKCGEGNRLSPVGLCNVADEWDPKFTAIGLGFSDLDFAKIKEEIITSPTPTPFPNNPPYTIPNNEPFGGWKKDFPTSPHWIGTTSTSSSGMTISNDVSNVSAFDNNCFTTFGMEFTTSEKIKQKDSKKKRK